MNGSNCSQERTRHRGQLNIAPVVIIRSGPDFAVLKLFRKVGEKLAVPLVDYGHSLCRDISGKTPRGPEFLVMPC